MNTFLSFETQKKSPVNLGLKQEFSWYSQRKAIKEINNILAGFDPVNLKEIEEKALMNRVDTKFMINFRAFPQILSNLQRDYFTLEVKENRISPYETLYYDTPRLDFYLSHHNGELNRYKIRSRQYVDSHLSFLEVKFKNNKKRTIKNRIKITGFKRDFDEGTLSFLKDNCPFDPQKLEARLWNTFYRITLVSKERIERLTLDLFLEFSNKYGRVSMPNMVIAEVKQEEFSFDSVFMKQMRENEFRSGRFSKYCLGTALLGKNIKTNNFKPEILRLKKIMNGELVYVRNN